MSPVLVVDRLHDRVIGCLVWVSRGVIFTWLEPDQKVGNSLQSGVLMGSGES